MRLGRNSWEPGGALIEWRASNIGDPLDRLRFLRNAAARRRSESHPRRLRTAALFSVVLAALVQTASHANARSQESLPSPHLVLPGVAALPNVWLVECSKDDEFYSNGLRVDTRFSVAHHARRYTPIDRRGPGFRAAQPLTAPAGIVYHSTESYQAPFDRSQNHVLRFVGESLLGYVRNRRAYHFVIDRFGAVHRIVQEADTANHAGRSVWADTNRIYLNLNSSFLGVAFEAQSQADGVTVWANQAQIRAGYVLTEMLRSKYGIPVENCVTHVQVSVNPDNMQIGYHTDFGNRFNFEAIGLSDNYTRLLPSICIFGFQYDASFLRATNSPLWTALALSEEQLRKEALANGLSLREYRNELQVRYRTLISRVTPTQRLENQNE